MLVQRRPPCLHRLFSTTKCRTNKAKQTGQTSNRGLQLAPQPSTTSEDGRRTLRVRKDGRHALPLPPIMDPIALDAKARHKQPKRVPEHDELTDFQRELHQDPYAHALATPVRRCAVSNVRLPSHFLQPFATAFEYPSTDESTCNKITPKLVPATAGSLDRATSASATAYLLNSRTLLKQLNTRHHWTRLVNDAMAERYAARAKRSAKSLRVSDVWTWDKEMGAVVLAALREEVMKGLRFPFRRPEGKQYFDHGEAMARPGDVACLLCRPQLLEPALAERVGYTEDEPLFWTTTLGEQYPAIRVYDFQRLLGDELILKLVQSTGFETAGLIAVRQLLHTLKTRMALDRLAGFLSPDTAANKLA